MKVEVRYCVICAGEKFMSFTIIKSNALKKIEDIGYESERQDCL